LIAIALFAQNLFRDAGCLAHVARSLVTKLIPTTSFQISLDERDQVLVISFFVANGQPFVVCHVLSEPWVPLNLSSKQGLENIFFG
jgi:hypothetical protein